MLPLALDLRNLLIAPSASMAKAPPCNHATNELVHGGLTFQSSVPNKIQDPYEELEAQRTSSNI